MRLLLIRHGQTPDNVRGALGTVIPGPGLTELGELQAAAVPVVLDREPIAAIYVSRMARTHRTAAPLAATLGLDPIELPGIHEIEAGEFEGRSDREAVRGYLSTIRAWGTDQPELAMPGAQTGHDFLQRYDDSIAAIEAEHAGHTVAVFSHAAAMRLWVRMRARGIDPEFTVYADLDNTGMAVLEGGILAGGEPGFELVSWRGAAAGLDDDDARDVTGEPMPEAVADAD